MNRKINWLMSTLMAMILAACAPASATNAPPTPPAQAVTLTALPPPTATPTTKTIAAKTCARDDVQEALTNAPDGSIVFIPAGECDWGSQPAVTRVAGVWLKGAGKDQTVITRSGRVFPLPYDGQECKTELYYDDNGNLQLTPCYGNPPPEQYLIQFDCANGERVEVSDLTLIGNDDFQSELERLVDADDGLGLIHGCVDFKIHDAAFNKFSNAGVTIQGGGRGVIYQNDFFSNFKCQDEETILPREDGTNWKITEPLDCLGYGVAVYGDDSYPAAIQLGTENAVFIEDNVFNDNRHAIASNHGSNYVVRYNSIAHTERGRNFGIVDAHGRGEYGPGSRSWEVYHNTLIDNTETQWNTTGILMRGGDGVVFDNIVPSTFGWGVGLTTEADCETAADYPLEDQTRQAYIWGNHAPNSAVLELPTLPLENYAPACLQEGRDFFLFEMPGYKPYIYPHPLREQGLF
ncbi:MAG: right-handed parallel beta-helix repeat-containing protein [Anaerolineales bacterium]|nr:right-handed parallel beta-helix repeat-containing protein [Anaerolineales bacterium]